VSRRLATLAMASGGAAAGAAALDVDRVRAALWGMHIGDALAMPVHWYYNLDQLKRDFGSITKYEAPKEKLPGSIMSLSSTGGGGRGSDAGTIVGDVILHGKRKYWARGGDYHYHRGMAPGENTLEVTVTRECFMASLSDSGMEFNREDVRDRYIRLMTTPDSHNDTYAGTCHRMFFANRENGKPLDDCPDNDQHNVDTIDGLVNLPPVIFAAAAAAGEAQVNATAAAAVTLLRRSSVLPQYAQVYAAMLMGVASGADLKETVSAAAASVGLDIERAARGRAPMVA
jgi:ADP-ribosylglycohydrolase